VTDQDDLFRHADTASARALTDRGIGVITSAGGLALDLRGLGVVEAIGTEAGAFFRFSGAAGTVRVLLAPAAFFTLKTIFAKGVSAS
jgi:hypothetical protein